MSSTPAEASATVAGELPPAEELEALVGRALDAGRAQGASAVEAEASVADGLSVGVRMGEVETLEYERDRGLSVTVSDFPAHRNRDRSAEGPAVEAHLAVDLQAG